MSRIFVDIAVDMVNLRQYLRSLLAIFRHTQDDCCAISTAITILGQNVEQYPRFLQFLLQYLRSKTISTAIPMVISTTISTGILYPLQYLRLKLIIIGRGYCRDIAITCCIFCYFPVISTNLIICSGWNTRGLFYVLFNTPANRMDGPQL